MNWGEFKNEIKDLGFEETGALNEYKDIIISAANRALHIINATVIPVISRYDFTQDGKETGIKKYDMVELATTKDGTNQFLAFADSPVKTYNGAYETFNDFEIEQGHIIVMDASIVGDFSVFYKKRPSKITETTTDNTELDIDVKVEPALPLLAAYYIWLDDDERKATQYYNQYDTLKSDLLMGATPVRARIIGGI